MKNRVGKLKPLGSKVLVALLVIIAFGLGYRLRGGGAVSHTQKDEKIAAATEPVEVQIWTCAMHPQIRQPRPGKCPICGMNLIPATSEKQAAEEGPREIRLSPRAEKLAEISVTPVERKYVSAEIRMVGKVEFDETRLAYITAWVPGRLDRLYVDYTGVPVKKGDHLVYLYSPELITAQQELIQALKTSKELEKSGLVNIKETAQLTVDAAREKLRLWGLTEEQVKEIERRGTPSDHMTIYAPITGIVIHKNAVEGMYVNTGTEIYTIADLSQVWVKLDAYESDVMYTRYGQEVEFQVEAYPGEIFKGRIAFIDPVLNERTRSVKVRVNAPNPDGRLKPQMLVHAVVRAKVAAGGKVMDPELSGKWICPMHPEIVKDDSGSCDTCEMPLMRAESLGYISVDADKKDAPLVIPRSAALITGKRAVVYVRVPAKEGTYEGREVVLGPRAGDYYLVREGLNEGDLVVVNGNFKIDSAIQIVAKPSMMNLEGAAPISRQHQHVGTDPKRVEPVEAGTKRTFEVPHAFKNQLESVYSSYFAIQQALSRDQLEEARRAEKKMEEDLAAVDMSLLKGAAHTAWMRELEVMKKALASISTAENIEKIRPTFAQLSESLISVAKNFGSSNSQSIFRFHCPMAFDGRGADWLQNKPETENPYFGQVMFRCGERTETISSGSAVR